MKSEEFEVLRRMEFLLSEEIGSERATGLSEGIPSEGGWLVKDQFSYFILEALMGMSKLRPFVDYLKLTTGKIKLPLIDIEGTDHPLIGYWVCEGERKEGSKIKIQQMLLDLKKLAIVVPMTDEIMADTEALESFLSKLAGEEFGFLIDKSIIRGVGGDSQPLGILLCDNLIVQEKEAEQLKVVNLQNIVKMAGRLWVPGRTKSTTKWLLHPTLIEQVFDLNALTNIVLMPPLSGFKNPSIMGWEVLYCSSCSEVGTVGDIILADLDSYMWVDRGKPKTTTSIHLSITIDSSEHGFLTDETFAKFLMRCDGGCKMYGPIQSPEGGETMGPFVCLETRPEGEP
ncbi:hypothetical protein ES702_07189 [subsurface metagenome]